MKLNRSKCVLVINIYDIVTKCTLQLQKILYDSFRTKSRKDKNKLASRACRLKKKAQHEANKIKLSGLEDEHSKLHEYFS